MDNLDLDINNYTIKDLERFFKISPSSQYTAADIEKKEYRIREQLLESGHINKRFKRDLIEFLQLAKEWLIFVKCPAHRQQPTSIPKNYKLDTMDTPRSAEAQSRAEDIITRPETQFVYANNSEFFPGSMNPLNTRVITKCINIDTRFRSDLYTTQSSDFVIQLPVKFTKVVSMQLSSLELPIAFYGISESYGNNFLYMAVTHKSIDGLNLQMTSERVFTIPDGNYNATDLVDTINGLLSPTNSVDFSLQNPNDIFSYIQLSIGLFLFF